MIDVDQSCKLMQHSENDDQSLLGIASLALDHSTREVIFPIVTSFTVAELLRIVAATSQRDQGNESVLGAVVSHER